ncbi:MAG: quinolinate synthase [Gammaproteobacteria bacterium RIFCSPHIGHO2_12_FULL_45_9]|nr:MAG: quinolinate synthase [Gammaproteobacteria bacterium RIFCSPHIGHO2_12_FULL_45_9]
MNKLERVEVIVPPTLRTAPLSPAVREEKIERAVKWLHAHDAVLIAHYYVEDDVQYLAERSGGFIADSLAMAQFGRKHAASTLVVAGVRFMGETAKILNPEKQVLMLAADATCSLDLGCPIDSFSAFCDEHPDRVVVVYANTSAAVKARADWVVTSANAVDIVAHLHETGHKVLFAPDRYLGDYIQKQTGADMLLWNAACVVHEEYRATALRDLKIRHPEATVLVHPESPMAVIAEADVVGSTTRLLQASQTVDAPMFIVATDRGLLYKMRQASPDKIFIEAPTGGMGATCRSCGHCPWMSMNQLSAFEHMMQSAATEIIVPDAVIEKARMSLERMLTFSYG